MQTISNIKVPPCGPLDAKIVFVGEAPGEDEERLGEPFVGRAGNKLMEVLAKYGIFREDVRLMNLCNYRPTFNNFDYLLDSEELADGKRELRDSLQTYPPTVIVPLGNHALTFLTGMSGISRYRGSIIKCQLDGCTEIKVIPTYHPSYVLRNPNAYPIFCQDVRRIIEDSHFVGCNYPKRAYHIAPTGSELDELIFQMQQADYLACDIETVKGTTQILCHGFADSAQRALCLPHEAQYLPYIYQLYHCAARKIFHYGLFDIPMLQLNGFDVAYWTDDTYIMQHALQPEMPASLEFLTSIHTREPYYKAEGRADIPDNTKAWSTRIDRDKLYIYNCKDVCCTMDIFTALQSDLASDPTCQQVYQYVMNLEHVALEIGQNGMYIDEETRFTLERALIQKWSKLQTLLNTINDGQAVNVNSNGGRGQVAKLLYEKLKLPKRTKENKVKTDEDALVGLIGVCQEKIHDCKTGTAKQKWQLKQEACRLILEIRGMRKLLSSYVLVGISSDGRARSIYNAAGTETGRWSASKFVDGTGFNPQTLPREAIDVDDTISDTFNLDEWIERLDTIHESEDNRESEILE